MIIVIICMIPNMYCGYFRCDVINGWLHIFPLSISHSLFLLPCITVLERDFRFCFNNLYFILCINPFYRSLYYSVNYSSKVTMNSHIKKSNDSIYIDITGNFHLTFSENVLAKSFSKSVIILKHWILESKFNCFNNSKD